MQTMMGMKSQAGRNSTMPCCFLFCLQAEDCAADVDLKKAWSVYWAKAEDLD